MLRTKQAQLILMYIMSINIVTMGEMKSRFPAKQGKSAMAHVSTTAFRGSSEALETAKGRKIGSASSFAIADRIRGALVKL